MKLARMCLTFVASLFIVGFTHCGEGPKDVGWLTVKLAEATEEPFYQYRFASSAAFVAIPTGDSEEFFYRGVAGQRAEFEFGPLKPGNYRFFGRVSGSTSQDSPLTNSFSLRPTSVFVESAKRAVVRMEVFGRCSLQLELTSREGDSWDDQGVIILLSERPINVALLGKSSRAAVDACVFAFTHQLVPGKGNHADFMGLPEGKCYIEIIDAFSGTRPPISLAHAEVELAPGKPQHLTIQPIKELLQ